MDLLTTGRWISGAEAADWGLALRAVPVAELDQELEAILETLRGKSRAGLSLIKSVTQQGQSLSLVAALFQFELNPNISFGLVPIISLVVDCGKQAFH